MSVRKRFPDIQLLNTKKHTHNFRKVSRWKQKALKNRENLNKDNINNINKYLTVSSFNKTIYAKNFNTNITYSKKYITRMYSYVFCSNRLLQWQYMWFLNHCFLALNQNTWQDIIDNNTTYKVPSEKYCLLIRLCTSSVLASWNKFTPFSSKSISIIHAFLF